MKKIAKAFVNIVLSIAILYASVFALWLVMANGCVEYEDMHDTRNECGNDEFTKMVRVVYSPVIQAIAQTK